MPASTFERREDPVIGWALIYREITGSDGHVHKGWVFLGAVSSMDVEPQFIEGKTYPYGYPSDGYYEREPDRLDNVEFVLSTPRGSRGYAGYHYTLAVEPTEEMLEALRSTGLLGEDERARALREDWS